ncbi:MAG: preprotein translocase subunit SecE [Gemmatimonadaceae bacterium]|nr:preprotein translocase subunit SecE [Gemmatimonadaceae bacterium]
MATDILGNANNARRSVVDFLTEVRTELGKVTWPDKAQLRQATVAIIIFVLLIGFVIFVMDWILQKILVQGIPSLFGA